MRAGEVLTINGLDALYRPREAAVLRSLVGLSDAGVMTPAEAWAQISLLHGLKATLDAVIVDEAEEALIRGGWDARDAADAALERQAIPA